MRHIYALIPLGIVVLLCLAFYHSDLRRTMQAPMVTVATAGPDQPLSAYEAARKAAQARFSGREMEFPTSAEGKELVTPMGNGVYTVSAWAHEKDRSGGGTYLAWRAHVRCESSDCRASRVELRG